MDNLEYKDLIKDSFGKLNNHTLKIRLKLLSSKFKGEIFLNHSHKERFYNSLLNQGLEINDLSTRDIAIAFLLTADENLWKLSEEAVSLDGFDFKKICLRSVNTEGYALYQTAKTISTGKEYIKVSEIIVRYGLDIFSITK